MRQHPLTNLANGLAPWLWKVELGLGLLVALGWLGRYMHLPLATNLAAGALGMLALAYYVASFRSREGLVGVWPIFLFRAVGVGQAVGVFSLLLAVLHAPGSFMLYVLSSLWLGAMGAALALSRRSLAVPQQVVRQDLLRSLAVLFALLLLYYSR